MNKKIIFTLFPKSYWIILAIAIAFVLLGDYYTPLANITFNVLFFLIVVKAGVLLHEVGHLLFAALVGGRPRRIVLGRGHKVVERTFKGIKVVLNSDFNSGFACAAFNNRNYMRMKLFVYVSGGFAVNFMIAGFFLLLFDFSASFQKEIHIVSVIVAANVGLGILALIPQSSIFQGMRLYSDGLIILRIPFLKESYLKEFISANEQLDAYDFFELKEYDKAIVIYESLKSQMLEEKFINVNLSICYLKLGKYQKAADLMEELIPFIDDKRYGRYKCFIYNGLAWSYLLLNRLDEADTYSELAYKEDVHSLDVKGTRGSVLIEMGRNEEGKDLLIHNVDFSYPNNQTLGAAIYLILAFHKLGVNEKAEKYKKFVTENIKVLHLDEKTLFDRVMEKIE